MYPPYLASLRKIWQNFTWPLGIGHKKKTTKKKMSFAIRNVLQLPLVTCKLVKLTFELCS